MRKDFYATYFALESEHWWFTGRRKIFIDLLEARGPEKRPLELLDFGCGTGAMLEHLGRFGTLSAADAEPEAVSFCHERGREEVRHVPAGAPLPFAEASFDLVTALDVIEHIADDVATLRELRRTMRENAVVLVAVPAYNFLWGDQDEISHHYRRYTAGSLRGHLEAAGFRIEHLSYYNTFLFLPIASVRIAKTLLRAPRPDQTDFELGPKWSNRLLAQLFAAESRLVKGPGLPFGVSVLALARPA